MPQTLTFDIKKYTYNSVIELLHEVVLLFSGATGLRIFDSVSKAIKSRSRTAPNKGLEKLSALYEHMAILQHNTECDRVNIYVVENSGGKNVVGNPQYMTLLYENFDKNLQSTKPMFVRYPLDESITRLLSIVCKKGCDVVSIEDKTMADGKVFETMTLRSMKFSIMYFLAQTETKSYFITCSSTTKEYSEIKEADKFLMNLGVENIRRVFKDTIKYIT